MKNLFITEIINLNQYDVEKKILGKTYKFHLNSPLSDIDDKLIIGKVVDYDLSIDNQLFSLHILIKNQNKEIEITILKIKSMEYVC